MLPYYLFISKIMLHKCFFCIVIQCFSRKNRKKILQFFAIFSLCVSISYEKVEKKVAQKS